MKLLSVFILLFFCLFSPAQDLTKQEKLIDSIFLNKINQYRNEHGVQKIVFYQKADSLAKSHNKYMLSSENITHLEVYGKDTLFPGKRIGLTSYNVENVEGGDLCKKIVISNIIYDTKTQLKNENSNLINYLVNTLFVGWKESQLHNKNLLDKNIHKGAVSVKFDFDKSFYVADFIAFD